MDGILTNMGDRQFLGYFRRFWFEFEGMGRMQFCQIWVIKIFGGIFFVFQFELIGASLGGSDGCNSATYG